MVETQERDGSKTTNEVIYRGVTIYAPGGDKRVGFNSEDVHRLQQLCDFAYTGSLGTTEALFLKQGAPIAEQITGYGIGKTDGLLKSIWTQVEPRRFKTSANV